MEVPGEASGLVTTVAERLKGGGARRGRTFLSGEGNGIPPAPLTAPAQLRDLPPHSSVRKPDRHRGSKAGAPKAPMPPVLGRLQQADLPPEIDFLRGSFPEALLTAAARRAAASGLGPIRC
jgi:hypothetical protein